MEPTIKDHRHNGNGDNRIALMDLFGQINTITVAADLTKALTSKPQNIGGQILIDTTTATKKLYIYDTIGNVWRSVTIA